jgi:hypothetical protein
MGVFAGHELDQTNVAIVSGSADKTAIIWKKNASGNVRIRDIFA